MNPLNTKMNYLTVAAVSLLVITIFATLNFGNRQVVKNWPKSENGKAELYVKGVQEPQGLAIDQYGNLFTQSSPDGKISIVNKDGKAFDYTYLDRFTGFGIDIYRDSNLLIAAGDKVINVDSFGKIIQYFGEFKKAYDIEVAPDDTIFVSDGEANTIYKISPQGDITEFLAFKGQKSNNILNVAGICFDKDFENLYCVNMYTGDMYKISLSKDLRAEKIEVITSDLNKPNFIDIDAEGNVYVTCLGDNTVVRVDQNSIVELIDTGARLSVPCGIVFNGSSNNSIGTLFVASKATNSIYKINIGIKNKDKK